MSEFREATSVELYDTKLLISNTDSEFDVLNTDSWDFHEYSSKLPDGVGIEKIWARIDSPFQITLFVEIKGKKPRSDEEIEWKIEHTYCGSFAVTWVGLS